MSRSPADAPESTDAGSNSTTGQTVNTDAMQWVSALAALAGLWIVASPFVYEATDAAYWNNTLVGTGIFLLAGYNFVRLSRDQLANTGIAALTVLLGLWIAISPIVVEMGDIALANSTTVTGAIVAVLAAYNAYTNNRADAPDRAAMRT